MRKSYSKSVSSSYFFTSNKDSSKTSVKKQIREIKNNNEKNMHMFYRKKQKGKKSYSIKGTSKNKQPWKITEFRNNKPTKKFSKKYIKDINKSINKGINKRSQKGKRNKKKQK